VDFELVLEAFLRELARQGVRYAAIGGFALGVLGAPRVTRDLDFLVHRDDLNKLHEILSNLGYRRVHHSENVSQYHHHDNLWGSVDFIHAFREVSLAMLERAKSYPAFGAKLSIRTLDPEDVIGLKVQAMSNDPDRRAQEVSDIERLCALYGAKLDWQRVLEYYRVFDLEDEAMGLKKRFGNVK